MRRLFMLLCAVTLMAAACGGGESSPETTTAPATTTTTAASAGTQAPAGSDSDAPDDAPAESPPDTPAPGSGSSSDFCRVAADFDDGEDLNLFGLASTPQEIEASFNTLIGSLDQAVAAAPSEIADDVAVLRQVFVDFAALLAEYEYDFLAIGAQAENDPRFLAFDEEAIEQAANNIAAFCGLDIVDGGGNDGAEPPPADTPDVLGDDLPESFPQELVPPDATIVMSFAAGGGQSVSFESTASFDDIVDYYTGILGPPLAVLDAGEGMVAQFADPSGSDLTSITVLESEPVGVAVTIGGG